MNNATFKVDGMHCGGCAETIQGRLERHAGVRRASVSFDTHEARVLYEPATVSEDELVAAIEKAGFRVAERRT